MGEHNLEGPKAKELEQNIKIAHNWMTALRSGTFKGQECLHIATLLDFLQVQHDSAVKAFEAMHPAPEFGKKPEEAKA